MQGILACPTSVGQELPVYTFHDIRANPYSLDVAAFYERLSVPRIRSSLFAKATQDTVERCYTFHYIRANPHSLDVAAFYERFSILQIRSSRFAKATQDTVERGYTLNDAGSSHRTPNTFRTTPDRTDRESIFGVIRLDFYSIIAR